VKSVSARRKPLRVRRSKFRMRHEDRAARRPQDLRQGRPTLISTRRLS
jgi:hypothetical protein